MADLFSSFARAPGPPYTRAVALVESGDEIEVTAAVFANGECSALLTFADSETPVWLNLKAQTEYGYRVRKVLSITPNVSTAAEAEGYATARLIGLY
jgi:alpha-D-ribose 1-methylphosphonate 5-triphosphate synthase subunit PhnH